MKVVRYKVDQEKIICSKVCVCAVWIKMKQLKLKNPKPKEEIVLLAGQGSRRVRAVMDDNAFAWGGGRAVVGVDWRMENEDGPLKQELVHLVACYSFPMNV